MTATEEPVQVTKRALDVTPHFHGIYCRIEGGTPFVNEIVGRHWSRELGERQQIIFSLESHNFDFRDPDEAMRVVELTPRNQDAAWFRESVQKDADEFRARPARQVACEHCSGTGKITLPPQDSP